MRTVELWRREMFARREFPFVPLWSSQLRARQKLDRRAPPSILTAADSQRLRRTDTSTTSARGTPSLSFHLVSGSDEKPDRKRELIPETSKEYP